MESWLQKDLNNMVVNYESNDDIKIKMDAIQRLYRCCGAIGPEDYPGRSQPDSCTVNDESNPMGCIREIDKYVSEHIYGALILTIVVGVFQFCGLMFSVCLCCGLRNLDDDFQK